MSERNVSAVLLALTRADKRLLAVGERGIILLSDDDGRSWRQAKVPVSVSLTNIHFATARKGWAVGHSGVVLHTKDGGQTWSKQFDGIQAAQRLLETAEAEAKRGDSKAQRQLAEAQRLVADGPDKPFLDVHFADEKQGFIIGAYGLFFTTQDGGENWFPWLDHIDNPQGKHLYGISAAGTILYIAGEQGALYRSKDGGSSFVELETPYSGSYFGVLQTQGCVLVYGLRGNAYWSNDAGQEWHKIEIGIPATITAGHVLADGSIVLANEAGGVLYSTDQGHRFEPLSLAQLSPFTGITESSDGSLILSGIRGITRITMHNAHQRSLRNEHQRLTHPRPGCPGSAGL